MTGGRDDAEWVQVAEVGENSPPIGVAKPSRTGQRKPISLKRRENGGMGRENGGMGRENGGMGRENTEELGRENGGLGRENGGSRGRENGGIGERSGGLKGREAEEEGREHLHWGEK
jgi:hypothetical protein